MDFAEFSPIARRVAEELPQDGVVVLDSGSLTLFCAQAMPKDTALAVVTNNLPAAQYFGRNSFCTFAAVNEVDLVITDAAANAEMVSELAAAGPEVVVAK